MRHLHRPWQHRGPPILIALAPLTKGARATAKSTREFTKMSTHHRCHHRWCLQFMSKVFPAWFSYFSTSYVKQDYWRHRVATGYIGHHNQSISKVYLCINTKYKCPRVEAKRDKPVFWRGHHHEFAHQTATYVNKKILSMQLHIYLPQALCNRCHQLN